MRHVVWTLALLAATPLGAAELGYHFTAGEAWTYEVQNTAQIPTQGEMVSDLTYAFQAASAQPIHLEVDIDGTSNRFDIQGSQASFDLDSSGQASNLQSDMLDDPVDGAFAKNAPGFFFPLPSGDVGVGDSWQAQQIFYFPPLDLPGAFTKLKTITTFTYQGTQELADGRTVHVIGTSAVHAPGSKQRVQLDGVAHFDAEAGRMVSTEISGIVRVKAGFLWVKVPTTLSLAEAAPAL